MAHTAPLLLASFVGISSCRGRVDSDKCEGQFNVGFEARVSRPFGGSGYDSDESIGIVASKNYLQWRGYRIEILEANTRVEAALAKVEVYREGGVL